MFASTTLRMQEYDDTNPELFEFLTSKKGILSIALAGLFVFITATLVLNFLGEQAIMYYAVVLLGVFFFIRHIVGENKIKMPSQRANNHVKCQ